MFKLHSNFSKNLKQFCFFFLICLFIVGAYSFFSAQGVKNSIKDPSLTKELVLTQFFNAPLYFEKNEGQIDPSFHYICRCPGHTCCFNSEGMILFMQSGKNREALSTLSMRFVGANPHSFVNGVDLQECKSNYFIGNDSTKWQSGISNYAKVSYENVYPGIDALFYGNAKQLEYDFLVAPGANPHHVRLQVEGAKDLAIDKGGNLQIMLEDQQIVQMKKPSIYQIIEGNKIEIAGEFILLAKNEIGFSLDRYDSNAQLVIDPILTYSTYLGGNGQDEAFGVAVDGDGNAYVTGRTASTNFPTTSGAYRTTSGSGGFRDVFVTKFNSNGSGLIYSTYLAGSASDVGNALTVDSDGSAYIVGFTESPDFPVTPGAAQTTFQGLQDAFITKLNPAGSGLVYSTYLGGAVGSTNQQGSAITLDSKRNAYVTGYTQSTTFPVTPGAFQTTLVAVRAGFITQINPEGTQFLYSTYLGGADGAGQTVGNGIVIDADSNVYVTGNTTSFLFPTTYGAFQTAFGGI